MLRSLLFLSTFIYASLGLVCFSKDLKYQQLFVVPASVTQTE